MKIDEIENGYVLDHITAGNGMRVYEALGLDKLSCQVAIIQNAKSKISITKTLNTTEPIA